MQQYVVNTSTKRRMDNATKKMREGLEDLLNNMMDIKGLDPTQIGFMRHLATILDSASDIDHINMIGDNTYNLFCEELVVEDNED